MLRVNAIEGNTLDDGLYVAMTRSLVELKVLQLFLCFAFCSVFGLFLYSLSLFDTVLDTVSVTVSLQ